MTRTICMLLLALSLVVAGCHKKPEPKRYPMQGEIKAVDPNAKTATIAAGKIGDWMEAMTMEYPVPSKSDFAKLRAGDKITATVDVSGSDYSLSNIQVQSGSQ